MRLVLASAALFLFACSNGGASASPAPTAVPSPDASSIVSTPTDAAAGAMPAEALDASLADSSATDASADADVDAPGGVAYDVLTNSRFGFSCDYPASFVKKPADSDGRGQTVTTKDGKAWMRCWAMYSHQPAKELYADWVRRPGLTKQQLDGNTWIVAGKDGGALFYSKSVLADGLITTVETHWDPSLDATYAPVSLHAADSLALLPLGVRLKNQQQQQKK